MIRPLIAALVAGHIIALASLASTGRAACLNHHSAETCAQILR